MALRVLYEDNHLIVVDKPAGLPTMGVAADRPSLVTVVKSHLKAKYQKPGNVYLGVVSRLDAPVSGVVVFARTSKAAARLNDQFRGRTVDKRYLALGEGVIEPAGGTCTQRIVHHEGRRRMEIAPAAAEEPQEARLRYRRLGVFRGNSLLAIELLTGRKHQIRLQLADRGHPLLGDQKYGAVRPFPGGIALHALRLELDHPVTHSRMRFEAPLPPPWRKAGVPADVPLANDEPR